MTQIVGSVLVRNEDVFVEQVDSQRRRVLRPHPRRRPRLERPHLGRCCRRSRASSTTSTCDARATPVSRIDCSRRTRAPRRGCSGSTATSSTTLPGSQRFRADLLAGAHADVFRLKAHVLNCDELADGRASGWLAPPSRPVTKLFNFGAVESWTDSPDPLQAGNVVFKPGQHWESRRDLADDDDLGDRSAALPARLLPQALERRRRRRAAQPRRIRRVRPRAVGLLKRLVRRPPERTQRCQLETRVVRAGRARDRRRHAFRRSLGFGDASDPVASSLRACNRVATGIERRGVVATYELHDRLLANRASRRHYTHEPAVARRDAAEHPPAAARGGLRDARRSQSSSPIPRSGTSSSRTPLASSRRPRRGSRASRREASRRCGGAPARSSSFASTRPASSSASTIRGCGSESIRACSTLANAYLEMWSKLEYVDVWYTPPAGADERRSSQRWHRDFNDRHLLKAFVYLVDVDEETGPFEYVPRSAPGGELEALWPWRPLGDNYPPEDELAEQIDDRAVTFTAPKGTIIFCNTSGFHRGGFATRQAACARDLTWDSPASLKALSERNYALRSEQRRCADRRAELCLDLTEVERRGLSPYVTTRPVWRHIARAVLRLDRRALEAGDRLVRIHEAGARPALPGRRRWRCSEIGDYA